MTRSSMSIIFVGLIAGLMALTAAGANAERSQDELAIKHLATRWQDAWNRHDADEMTALLAEDVDFVTVLGPKGWLKGKPEFQRAHAAMHKTLFTDSVWSTKETHVKFLRPDLAIARVLWSTTGDKVRHVKHGEPREGIFTWLVEKRDGNWLVIASQNTEVMPILPGQ